MSVSFDGNEDMVSADRALTDQMEGLDPEMLKAVADNELLNENISLQHSAKRNRIIAWVTGSVSLLLMVGHGFVAQSQAKEAASAARESLDLAKKTTTRLKKSQHETIKANDKTIKANKKLIEANKSLLKTNQKLKKCLDMTEQLADSTILYKTKFHAANKAALRATMCIKYASLPRRVSCAKNSLKQYTNKILPKEKNGKKSGK